LDGYQKLNDFLHSKEPNIVWQNDCVRGVGSLWLDLHA
jgi:hypothetical protein